MSALYVIQAKFSLAKIIQINWFLSDKQQKSLDQLTLWFIQVTSSFRVF